MTIFLGIDAGNSKTAVLACLASGKVAGAARSGCGDIYGAPGEAAAVRAVLGAADSALADAGAGRRDVASAAFRLAGVDWPEDWQFWDEVLSAEWPDLTRSILNDGYAAIRSGEPSGVGVAVNAGTNAAIAARGPDGTTWDMSWWGQHAMGGFGLVSEALRAAFLAEIDAAPATALGPALVDFWGLPDLTELNRWFTRRRDAADPAERPRAARVVTEAARQGDRVAIDIVREQGRRLAFYAEIAARHAGLRDAGAPIPVVMSGSILMDRDSVVAAALREQLAALLPGADPRPAVLPPAAGAALDALAEGGVTLTPEVVDRLTATLPPPPFFQT
jgi:N-acetylglucosamine kinase-like BadF-type ATPase